MKQYDRSKITEVKILPWNKCPTGMIPPENGAPTYDTREDECDHPEICDECDQDPITCDCSIEDCESAAMEAAAEYQFEGRREC